MKVKHLLLIDDEEKLRRLMARIITLEGFEVTQAENARAAQKKLAQDDYDVIVCDVKLPDANGVEFVKEIREKQPLAEILLLTAYGNIPDGVQAIKNGAFDYITKGDDNNKIIPLVHRAYEKNQLARRVRQLEQQVGNKYAFENILGTSGVLRDAIMLAKKVAPTDTSVLLLGETGTGKEVFAQAIHSESHRRNKPFLALNCAAFGRELLESELFGHKAGAFTGAVKDKKGLFTEASSGTLFLDEIGEMAHELQAKLLRVLETGEFFRIGETTPTRADVRLITATNRNLDEEIRKGNFRSDLYYRISVFSISLPPLRERRQDIRLLAKHFTQFYAARLNKGPLELTDDYLNALERSPWKGNIRELKNVIERSVILANHQQLDTDALPLDLRYPQETDNPDTGISIAAVEKEHIRKVLHQTHGNKTEAARLLRIGIATLYRKIEEYKLQQD